MNWKKIKESWFVEVILGSIIISQLVLLLLFLVIGIFVVIVTFDFEYFQPWTSEGWIWYRGISVIAFIFAFCGIERERFLRN
jgi:hypothetical protein